MWGLGYGKSVCVGREGKSVSGGGWVLGGVFRGISV